MIKLIHGDCLDYDYSDKIDCVITDPPYGLNTPYYSYDDTEDNLNILISNFMPKLLALNVRTLILCGPTQITKYPQYNWCSIVCWNTTGSFGKMGYNQWTPILIYGNDIKGFGSVNGVLKSDCIKISGGVGIGFMRGEDEKKHPCPKPITMMDAIIKRYTNEGETILDIFCGSGTTGIACVKNNRNFIGIEKEKQYYDIAVKRITDAGGNVIQQRL